MTDYKVEGKQEPGHAHSKDLNKSDVLNKKAMSVTALSRRLASSFGPAEAALTQNLKSFQHFHHKYMVFRANHLSQVNTAMYRLGASGDALVRWTQVYAKRLEPAQPKPGVFASSFTRETWRTHLGDSESYPQFMEFFSTEHDRYFKSAHSDRVPAWLQLLREYAPALQNGLLGDAAHGVIQLGWAIPTLQALGSPQFRPSPSDQIELHHYPVAATASPTTAALQGSPQTGDRLGTLQELSVAAEDMLIQGLAWTSSSYFPQDPELWAFTEELRKTNADAIASSANVKARRMSESKSQQSAAKGATPQRQKEGDVVLSLMQFTDDTSSVLGPDDAHGKKREQDQQAERPEGLSPAPVAASKSQETREVELTSRSSSEKLSPGQRTSTQAATMPTSSASPSAEQEPRLSEENLDESLFDACSGCCLAAIAAVRALCTDERLALVRTKATEGPCTTLPAKFSTRVCAVSMDSEIRHRIRGAAEHAVSTMLTLTDHIQGLEKLKAVTNPLTATLALMYSSSGNDFFVLHAVTSFFGIRQILSCLPTEDAIALLKEAFACILLIFVAQGMPGINLLTIAATRGTGVCALRNSSDDPVSIYAALERPLPTWTEISEKALTCSAANEHAPKVAMVMALDSPINDDVILRSFTRTVETNLVQHLEHIGDAAHEEESESEDKNATRSGEGALQKDGQKSASSEEHKHKSASTSSTALTDSAPLLSEQPSTSTAAKEEGSAAAREEQNIIVNLGWARQGVQLCNISVGEKKTGSGERTVWLDKMFRIAAEASYSSPYRFAPAE